MSKKKIKKYYWVARDKSTNRLYAYLTEPIRKPTFFTAANSKYLSIQDTYNVLFEDVTWENSPKLIKIKIKKKKEICIKTRQSTIG